MKLSLVLTSLVLFLSNQTLALASVPVVEFDGQFKSAAMTLPEARKALGNQFKQGGFLINKCTGELEQIWVRYNEDYVVSQYLVGFPEYGTLNNQGILRDEYLSSFRTQNPRNILAVTGLHVGSDMEEVSKAYNAKVIYAKGSLSHIIVKDANGVTRFDGYKNRVFAITMEDKFSYCPVTKKID